MKTPCRGEPLCSPYNCRGLMNGVFMGNRRRSREFVLQILYQMDIGKTELAYILDSFWKDNDTSEETQEFTIKLAKGTVKHLAEIDTIIAKHTKNWDIQRMASIDRNILRFSTFELLFLADIPTNVTINEAVELAKKYSTIESGKFVNGVLDKIKDERKWNL